nr:hypothetical protein [Mycobacterium tuberculosis]
MTPITALPTELAAMREVVETLAPIERAAGEPGEHKAAEWIVERLRTAGAQDARIEEEQYLDGYPRLHLKLSVIGVAAGVAGLLSRRLRIPAALAGVGAGWQSPTIAPTGRALCANERRRPGRHGTR